MPPADLDVALRVAGPELERRRGGGDALHHHGPVEADPQLSLVDLGPGLPVEPPCLGLQHAHADLFQDDQRRRVDGLDLVGGQDLDRRVRSRAAAERGAAGCSPQRAARVPAGGVPNCVAWAESLLNDR